MMLGLITKLGLLVLSLTMLTPVQGRQPSISSCERIGVEYAEHVLNEYLVEKSKENESDFKYVLVKNELFGGTNLIKAMGELRETMMNSTLRIWHLGMITEKHMYPSHNNIRYTVEQSYQDLMNLKAAQWKQEKTSQNNIQEMKELGNRLDMAFFLLLMRCLLPPVPPPYPA